MSDQIYFARVAPDGPIKIGISGDPISRIAGMQTGCPWQIDLIGATGGSPYHEQFLHERHASVRIRGEWFEPTDAVLRDVEQILEGNFEWPDFDRVDFDRRFEGPWEQILFSAGGSAALAKKLGLARQAIYQWPRVPALRVLTVEQITGIPRHKLRPDLYPAERERAVS